MSSDGGLLQFAYLNKDAMVISTSVFCALTILPNLFMMIVILAAPKLRTSPKHILIFVLCLVDLYSGVFELPLLAEYYSLERWTHDPNILKALDNGAHHVAISLRMTIVISICANSVLSILTRNKEILTMLSVSMIIASLGYSLVFVLPVTEGPPHLDWSDSCYWNTVITKQTSLAVAGFFPQVLVMIVLAVDIVIMHCRFSRSLPVTSDEGPRTLPVDVLLACVLMVVYYTPSRIVVAYYSSCGSDFACNTMHIVRGVTLQWGSVRSCVMPFVWLLCRDTRRSIKQACCCRSEPPSNLTGNTHDIRQYQIPDQHQVIVSKM